MSMFCINRFEYIQEDDVLFFPTIIHTMQFLKVLLINNTIIMKWDSIDPYV